MPIASIASAAAVYSSAEAAVARLAQIEGLVPEEYSEKSGSFHVEQEAFTTTESGTGPNELSVGTIRIDSLGLKFEVDREFAEGSSVAVVGESGVGESSFLKAIVRLVDSTGSSIWSAGTDLTVLPVDELRRRVLYLDQESQMFGENLMEMVLLGRSFSSTQLDTALSELQLDSLGNALYGDQGRLEKRLENLSGGERKRLSLLRAAMSESPIILFDEPTSGLDAVSQRSVESLIFAKLDSRIRIVATHQIDWLDKCDTVILLAKGGDVISGTLAEIKDEPRFKDLVAGPEECRR
ncbi:ATP-binding cassette domain-containing protein [Corynebacterium cystitidis]|uniref:ATP-binding cassette domain-containing protein n=1 Tax=Corynebacterium cystitidis TaxID=35757 RepID=UPI00211EF1C0|nr:ATP-binding cassette domain-containing protein [Corynebacterium cystitidis]